MGSDKEALLQAEEIAMIPERKSRLLTAKHVLRGCALTPEQRTQLNKLLAPN